MQTRQQRLAEAAKNLETIMENIAPYVHRPVVVVEPTTRGRWARATQLDDHKRSRAGRRSGSATEAARDLSQAGDFKLTHYRISPF